jgi:hypothetical protein
MGPFPHDAPPAAITAQNSMGTDGFVFVEFAHPEPPQLHSLFRSQLKTKTMGQRRWTKRSRVTGEFMYQKKAGKFKSVRSGKERQIVIPHDAACDYLHSLTPEILCREGTARWDGLGRPADGEVGALSPNRPHGVRYRHPRRGPEFLPSRRTGGF